MLKKIHLPHLDVSRELFLYSRKRYEMPVGETGASFAHSQAGIPLPIGFAISSTDPGGRHVMHSGSLIVEAWEVVPILLLLLVGGLIAIGSGVHRLASPQDARQLAGNLSGILLRVIGYLVAILLVHDWIGIRPGLGW
jgi:hypothetical protein